MDVPSDTRKNARRLRAKMSRPEVVLWKCLKGRKLDGLHFRNQHPVGRYVLDFYCHSAKLCVEVDGSSHGFGDRPRRDERRDAWLAEQGIRTLRLTVGSILPDPDPAVRTILGVLRGEIDV